MTAAYRQALEATDYRLSIAHGLACALDLMIADHFHEAGDMSEAMTSLALIVRDEIRHVQALRSAELRAGNVMELERATNQK